MQANLEHGSKACLMILCAIEADREKSESKSEIQCSVWISKRKTCVNKISSERAREKKER